MERLVKLLDECDDLLDVFRVQGRAMLVTALVAVVLLAGAGLMMIAGAPDLLAAP